MPVSYQDYLIALASDIPDTLPWTSITGTPTTFQGYGITGGTIAGPIFGATVIQASVSVRAPLFTSATTLALTSGAGALTLTATAGTLGLVATGANVITFTTNGAAAGRFTAGQSLLLGSTTQALGTPRVDIVQGLSTSLWGAITLTDSVIDATAKRQRILLRHYTNAEEPLVILGAQVNATTARVMIGGGTFAVGSVANTATAVEIYTAADNVTTTGTLAASWNSAGTFAQVGNATIGGTLGVTGAVTGGTYNGQTISSAASFTGTVAAVTHFSAPLLIGTTRVTAPLLGTTSAVDVVFDRNSVTKLTLGDTLATLTTTLALGTNSITSTGSLGATGARLTKGWFTDLEVTNAIAGSITGNAATATALQTSRTINGVGFDGTANIVVPNSNIVSAAGSITAINMSAGGIFSVLSEGMTIAAGDTVEVEVVGTILNDTASGAGLSFSFIFTLGALTLTVAINAASSPDSTTRVAVAGKAVFSVASSSSAAVVGTTDASVQIGAGTGTGSVTRRMRWQVSGSDVTGSQTLTAEVNPGTVLSTSTFYVNSFTVTQIPAT